MTDAPPPTPDRAVDPGGIEIAPGVRVSESDLRLAYARSSGPGGQNVNKLNTKAELWVPITALRGLHPEAVLRLRGLAGKRITKEDELHIVAETARTQEGNRSALFEKLRELLVQAMHRPKKRRATRPSRASKLRRLENKKRRGQAKAYRRGLDRE